MKKIWKRLIIITSMILLMDLSFLIFPKLEDLSAIVGMGLFIFIPLFFLVIFTRKINEFDKKSLYYSALSSIILLFLSLIPIVIEGGINENFGIFYIIIMFIIQNIICLTAMKQYDKKNQDSLTIPDWIKKSTIGLNIISFISIIMLSLLSKYLRNSEGLIKINIILSVSLIFLMFTSYVKSNLAWKLLLVILSITVLIAFSFMIVITI